MAPSACGWARTGHSIRCKRIMAQGRLIASAARLPRCGWKANRGRDLVYCNPSRPRRLPGGCSQIRGKGIPACLAPALARHEPCFPQELRRLFGESRIDMNSGCSLRGKGSSNHSSLARSASFFTDNPLKRAKARAAGDTGRRAGAPSRRLRPYR